jgi:hypothetical protein
MKERIGKRTLLSLCVVVLIVLGLVLQLEHRRRLKAQRLQAVSGLRQIGLAFRMDRNTYHGRFALTGDVVAPVPVP